MFRLLIFVYITFLFFKNISGAKIRETHISDKHFFEVQIADKSYEKRQGLMFIKQKLKSNQGSICISRRFQTIIMDEKYIYTS